MAGNGPAIGLGMGIAAAIGAVTALLLRPGPAGTPEPLAAAAPGPAAADRDGDAALRALAARVQALEDRVRALQAPRPADSLPPGSAERPATRGDSAGEVAATRTPTALDAAAPVEALDAAALDALGSLNGRSELLARFGKPDREDDHGDNGSTLHFFARGLRVRMDARGQIEGVRLFGRAETEHQNQMGRFEGIYRADTPWYQPRRWTIDGVSSGMHAREVYRRWGDPDRNEYSQNGEEWAIYVKRRLRLDLDREHIVKHIEYDPTLG